MPRVTQTVRAERDLDDIWLHIAVDNLAAADDLIDTLIARSQLIATQPQIGRSRPELLDGLRSYAVARYVIFYRPEHDGIELVRVLHGARDISSADFFN